MVKKFSKQIQESLGFYVYALIDPFSKKIFYIGKASSNNRPFDHLKATKKENKKARRIKDIRKKGGEPVIEIMRHKLKSEAEAFAVEGALIDEIGINNLTNEVKGHNSKYGRITFDEAQTLYGSKPIKRSEIKESYMMFYVNQSFNSSLREVEVYDATRQFWYKVGKKRRARDNEGNLSYNIALAVYHSVVIRAYTIEEWFEGGTTFSTRLEEEGHKYTSKDRWEFVGKPIIDHKLLWRRLVTDDGKDIIANQQGFGYIN